MGPTLREKTDGKVKGEIKREGKKKKGKRHPRFLPGLIPMISSTAGKNGSGITKQILMEINSSK